MNIFHVITLSSLGGSQSVVVTLANNQVKEHDVWIIASAGGEAWKSLDKRVKVIAVPELKRAISPVDLIVFIKLLFYRFKYNPDIVHLHTSKAGTLGRLAFSPFKTVYTVHGFDAIRLANRKFLVIEKILQYWCRAIVGVSRYDLDHLHLENIKRNVSFIYNVFFDHSKEIGCSSPLTNLINEKRRFFKKTVMCIARDSPQKKPELFDKIAKLHPEYFFIWVGNKKSYSNSENLYWAGEIPEAYSLLPYSDLVILPTNYEGLPMCILEAFSFSKPVIASCVGGIPELLDGVNGKAVTNSAGEFSSAIRHFLDGVIPVCM